MRTAALLALATALAPVAASAAEVASTRPESLGVVIYRDPYGGQNGVAMIVETRTLELPAGASTVRFEGVADTLIPQTAAVEGLPAPVDERNFDYDLLTPGALVARAVGQPVRLVRTNPGSGRVSEAVGLLRSGPQGMLFESDGKVEALKCSGLPEKLVFDRRPEGLSDRPTLSLRVVVPSAGRYPVTLSYLAGGFDWKADYVARVNADGRTLDLSGWLTLTNRTATSYADAQTQVVAGRLERSGETVAPQAEGKRLTTDCWASAPWWALMRGRFAAPPPAPPPPPSAPMAMMARGELQEVVVTATRKAVQSELGDYKLYTLPDRSTVAANQTKQVAFLDTKDVPFERVYRVGNDGFGASDLDPALVLRLRNTRAGGLGAPLPAGMAALVQDHAGRPLLVGENQVQDTAVGLPLDIPVPADKGVGATLEAVTEGERAVAGKDRRFTSLRLTLVNRRQQPAEVEFRQGAGEDGFKVVRESAGHATREGDAIWTLRLAAGETRTLSYEIEADAD